MFRADAAGLTHGFLATKEQFNGKASGVGRGEGDAAVEIAGTFSSPIDLDLCAATLTITSLLNEQAGSGELVAGLPLVLTAAPGSRRNWRYSQIGRARTSPRSDPGRRVEQVHLQDQSARRDHHLPAELFAESTHDQLPSRRRKQAAHRCQHGAIVVLLRPVEQVSQDPLSGQGRPGAWLLRRWDRRDRASG